MKKTARKDALRNIKKRFVSWLSMVTIVLIGTSVILGLFFTSRSLSYYGNQYLSQLNAKTMDLACSLGVREAELDRVLQIEGIKDVEGVISFTGQINAGARNNGTTLVSDTEHIIMLKLESSGFMFLRRPYVSAWILAVGCNALFSIIINTVSFSKIGKVPLTDITKY